MGRSVGGVGLLDAGWLTIGVVIGMDSGGQTTATCAPTGNQPSRRVTSPEIAAWVRMRVGESAAWSMQRMIDRAAGEGIVRSG